ncbi:MAG: condensation domain-containing protein, partial [Acidobacteria bacterium]|jgi:hypothetical protein|nr:condensation domain-containing protein [Acidobacteriota bacterium]
MQRVHRDVDFQIHLMEAKEEEIDELVKTSIQPFDLSNAPLLRVELFRFSQEKHLLIYNLHHIITDGTSMGILIRDFIRLYKRLKLQTLPIQYRDFAIWQNHQFQLQFIKKQEEYWLGVFPNKETIPVLEMPTDFPRPPVQIFDGNYLDFKLSRELTILLRKVMAGSGATLYMVLLAIYNILLSKYSGQEDIVTGIPIQGRNHPDLENMIGFFVNTLAIRSFPASDKMFMDFLDEVKENSLKAYENQDFQFEELVARLGLQPDPGRQALFSTMFEHSNMNQPDEIGSPVQSMAQDTLKIADLCFKQYEFKNNIIQFDLLLHAFDAREIIEFRLLYSTNLFKKETVERFSRHLINITSEVVSNPYIKISDIQVFSQEEAGKIMALCSSETIDTLEIDLEF